MGLGNRPTCWLALASQALKRELNGIRRLSAGGFADVIPQRAGGDSDPPGSFFLLQAGSLVQPAQVARVWIVVGGVRFHIFTRSCSGMNAITLLLPKMT